LEINKSKRPDWTRDETILALQLYQKHWPISGEADDRVKELSAFLRNNQPAYSKDDPKFRNPAGVYRKLTNLLSVDPTKQSAGSPHASEMDRAVFAEFGGTPDKVDAAADRIRKQLEGADDLAVQNERKIWITGMWGFDPSRWGFLGFTEPGAREQFLQEYEPSDLVLVVGQNSEMAAEADVGRLLGFLRITKEKIFDYERMPADEYERKLRLYGRDRWSFAMPANAAWRIGTEVRVKHVLPATYSGRWPQLIGTRYRQVLPEEVKNLQGLRLLPSPVFGDAGWNASLAEMPPSGHLSSLVTRGPKPRFGSYNGVIADSIGWLYIFRLAGITDRNFSPPDGKPLANRGIYKVGWCADIKRRLKTLNSSFPGGVSLRWEKYDARSFSDRDRAYKVEQEIFDWVRTQSISLGGEFIIGEFELIAGIQARWFSSLSGKIGAA